MSTHKKCNQTDKKISALLHLARTTTLWIRSSYLNLQDKVITHDCHNWAQVTNMCQLSTTLCLASGYQSSWSFSSLPLLTLAAMSTSEELSGLIYGEVILLHRLCLQHVFTLQALLLDLHQRVEYWVREDASEAESASIHTCYLVPY